MAHKTLIGGTAYEIGGGKTLVGGTAYSIDKGKTLVGGTVYEVGFGVPVNLTIYADAENYAFIMIDGNYVFGYTTVEVLTGTVIKCDLFYGYSRVQSYITVNGNRVFETNGKDASYDYTVTSNATISLNDRNGYGYIEITET